MKLRNRIITTVAFIMLLSLFVLLLVSITGNMYRENSRKRDLERMVKKTVPDIYRKADGDKVFLTSFLDNLSFIADWRLKKGENVTAGADNATEIVIGKPFISVMLREPDEKLLFIVQGNNILNQSHVTFLLTGVIFTVFLTAVLYLRLSHLVIRPVEIVIEACRNAGNRIPPGRNPMPAREDETGIMVRELYGLLAELFEYREQLEEKVKEASLRVLKTQEELILSQRLSATGKLAAGIAHEINNPLGGMMNAVNKLKKAESSGKDREYFELLEDCIGRIEKLVKELLTFVRKRNEFSPVDLSECSAFVRRMVAHLLKEKGAQLKEEIEPGARITGDAGQIQQLLLNLILNSIDSVGPESGIITVSCRTAEDSVILSVRDNGEGIPEGDRDQVFDLFFTTKESGKGTGLGLGIVHSIVENHNGTINIKSIENEMTEITIAFPLPKKEKD